MFKNFLDKAKSAIDDVDGALKLAGLSGSQVKAKKAIEYDASFFTFQLEGGPLHSSKLNAVAKIKAGEKAGEIIPLECTWFITSLDGKVREIEDLTSTTYQPCTEDVGLRISVKAEPVIEGGVYSGMPVYGEAGPIVLDSVVEDKVMEHLQNKLCEVTINIEEIPFEIENLPSAFPIEGVISLNKENKTLEVFMVEDEGQRTLIASCGYSDQYPAIEFIRKAPTLFELQLSETKTLKLSTETNIDRDVICTAIRMFGNDDLKEQEPEQELPEISESSEEGGLSVQTNSKTRKRNGSSNLEILMKRERLIKQIKQLEKDNTELTKTVTEEKESKEKLQTEIEELNKKVEGNDATVLKLQEEIEKLQKDKSSLAAEKVFLAQEVSLYRSQNTELENIIKDYEAQSLKSKESIDNQREKDREFISFEFQETIKGLETKLVNATMEIEQLKQENDQANQKYQLIQNDIEQKDASMNALQRKIQSLVQENARLLRSKSPTKGESSTKVFEVYGEEIIKLQCFNQDLQKIQGGEEGKPLIQDLEKLVAQLNEKVLETQGFFENLASKNQ